MCLCNMICHVSLPLALSCESDEDTTESYTMSYESAEDIDDDPLPKLSNRHVLLYYKTPEAWPCRIEGSEFGPLPKFFASALKAQDITVNVRFPAQFVCVSDCFFLPFLIYWSY
ncbi:hypothetical protein C1H46_014869 [Malus baccata]|uniref:Thioredoxin domain-containing protein n=1 Tax=Malus baccata TaxID=106549 RepID=A0A540ML67_MALBA|nr:hypothetical protein C1H46_014869 [Malus baccata]